MKWLKVKDEDALVLYSKQVRVGSVHWNAFRDKSAGDGNKYVGKFSLDLSKSNTPIYGETKEQIMPLLEERFNNWLIFAGLKEDV